MLNCFSYIQLCAALWTVAHSLLCPWDSPGRNTGVGCHAFLQGLNPWSLARGFFTTSATWKARGCCLVPSKSHSDCPNYQSNPQLCALFGNFRSWRKLFRPRSPPILGSLHPVDWLPQGLIGSFEGGHRSSPASCCPCPWVILPLWLWAEPRDLLLMSRIRQRLWYVTSEIRLQETVACLGHSHFPPCLL